MHFLAGNMEGWSLIGLYQLCTNWDLYVLSSYYLFQPRGNTFLILLKRCVYRADSLLYDQFSGSDTSRWHQAGLWRAWIGALSHTSPKVPSACQFHISLQPLISSHVVQTRDDWQVGCYHRGGGCGWWWFSQQPYPHSRPPQPLNEQSL